MFQVEYFRGKNELAAAFFVQGGSDVADVGADARDLLGYIGNHSGTVFSHEPKRYRIRIGSLRVRLHPLDLDDSLGIDKQAGCVRTTRGMNGDALAARDEPHDLLAPYRITATRAIDHYVVDAFYGN